MQQMMLELILKLLQNEDNKSSSSTSTKVSNSLTNKTNLSSDFSNLVSQISEKYGVDEDLVNSVIKAESNFNPDAVSYCGALGLMQLMPSTAAGLGVTDALDPEQNIDGGVRYMKQLLDKYNGNKEYAAMAYNWGMGNVDSYIKTGKGAKGQPVPRETQNYIKQVLKK